MFTRPIILIIFALFYRNIMAIDISSTPKVYCHITASEASKKIFVFKDAITIYLSGTKGKSYDVFVENPDLTNKHFAIIASNGDQEIPLSIQNGGRRLSQTGIIFQKKNDRQDSRNIRLNIVFKAEDIEVFNSKSFSDIINFSIKEN